MHLLSPFRRKLAGLALAATVGAGALVSAQPAQADPFVAGLVGGFVGAALLPQVYPGYSAYPAYPVYAAPPIYVEPAPVVVYEEPVYSAPVYSARPAYSGPSGYRPAYPQRHSLAEVESYQPRYEAPREGGPRVLTYEDTVGGDRVASAEPWSPEWYDYCRSKFRSFDERSGTFLGFDGQRHFCTVK